VTLYSAGLRFDTLSLLSFGKIFWETASNTQTH
jgi:hypothetical protein